jgi:hypothetical protein
LGWVGSVGGEGGVTENRRIGLVFSSTTQRPILSISVFETIVSSLSSIWIPLLSRVSSDSTTQFYSPYS